MPSQEDAGADDHNFGAGHEVPPNDDQRIAAAFEAYIRDRKSSDGKNAKHNRKIRQWTRVGVIGGLFYAFLTLWIATASIVTVFISKIAVEQATRAADIAANSQRAWMAPIRVHLLHAIDPKIETATIIVDALNVGREPALGVVSIATVDVAPSDGIQDRHACRNVSPSDGETVVWPSDRFGATLQYATDFSNKPGLMNDVAAGKQILFIEGCIAYKTIGKPHYSQYCFYLYPEIGVQTGVEIAKAPAEWTFRSCPIGNDAN